MAEEIPVHKIHKYAIVNCEKIISQLGKNIFPVGQIIFPS